MKSILSPGSWPRARRRASALLQAVLIIALVAGMVGLGTSLTTSIFRNVDRTRDMQRAAAIADGCIEYAYTHWRAICRSRPEQDFTSSTFAAIAPPASTLFPDEQYTLRDEAATGGDPAFAIRAIEPTVRYADGKFSYKILADNAVPAPAIGQTSANRSVFYLANANVQIPTSHGNLVYRLKRVLEKQRENPWQYAVFYENDCEIHPGPAHTIDGWVHTNGTLYTAHDTLTLADKTTFAGEWHLDFHPLDSYHASETPTRPSWPSDLPPAVSEPSEPLGYDPTAQFDSTDGNPNNDGYIELIEPPVAGFSDPLEEDDRRFWYQADLRIIINTDQTLQIQLNDGTVVTAQTPGIGGDVYRAVNGALTLNGSLRDNRVGADVLVHTLDVGKLSTALDGGDAARDIPSLGVFPWNGVVYMVDKTANPAAGMHRAFCLNNGGCLTGRRRISDSTLIGLTAVSQNPVYVRGDYNTGSTWTTQPASNTARQFDQRAVPGYEVRPAAIVADAVNVLSNAWTNANSTASLGSRAASNTTVNCAFVAGIVPTGMNGATYSGGVENFPRFLEDWSPSGSARYFTYYGSMIQLFFSKQATNRWGMGNVYDPPNRRWFFETLFLRNPPPGFLYTIKFIRQRWDATTAYLQN